MMIFRLKYLNYLTKKNTLFFRKCLNNSGQIDELAPWRQALNKELKDSLLNICNKLMQTGN